MSEPCSVKRYATGILKLQISPIDPLRTWRVVLDIDTQRLLHAQGIFRGRFRKVEEGEVWIFLEFTLFEPDRLDWDKISELGLSETTVLPNWV